MYAPQSTPGKHRLHRPEALPAQLRRNDSALYHADNRPVQGKLNIPGFLQEPKPVQGRFHSGLPVQMKVGYVQKKLPKSLQKTLVQQLVAYNTYSLAKSNTQFALHRQFEMLHGIESTINTYLKDNTKTIPNEERLELFRLLRQTENDHIKLTGRLAQHGHDIWLGNTNLSGKKQKQTQKLWHSLRRSQGNVKIDSTNKDFKNQVLSGYVHMLGGDHGRGLLRELNKFHPGVGNAPDPEKHIRISDTFENHFRNNLHKPGEYKPGSWASAMGQVIHSNQDHQTGVGSGSFVQIQNDTPGKWGDYGTDISGKPLHSPKYITLSHELGHARHNLRGVSGYNDTWPDQMDHRDPLSGPGKETERRKWSGSEEFINITHEENQLRREHGLPLRKYHATKNAQIARTNTVKMKNLLDTLDGLVPNEPRYVSVRQQLGVFSHRIEVTTDMANQSQVSTLRKDMLTFQQNVPQLLQAARRRHTINRVKSWIPSRNKLIGGSIGLLGTGLSIAYYNEWFNKK